MNRKFIRIKKNRKGITFLEIMFASMILAVALLPIIQSSSQNVKRAGFNIYRTTATMLANQLMERYKSMPYSWLTEQFGAESNINELIQKDPVMSSPFVPEAYKKQIADRYEVTGSFKDIKGDETIGLLCFNIKWKRSARAVTSSISLAKTVINYEKFGIQTSGSQGSFLQDGSLAPSSLNSSPGSSDYSGTDGTTAASPTISSPLDAIDVYGSSGC